MEAINDTRRLTKSAARKQSAVIPFRRVVYDSHRLVSDITFDLKTLIEGGEFQSGRVSGVQKTDHRDLRLLGARRERRCKRGTAKRKNDFTTMNRTSQLR